jgi:hypothetical protein
MASAERSLQRTDNELAEGVDRGEQWQGPSLVCLSLRAALVDAASVRCRGRASIKVCLIRPAERIEVLEPQIKRLWVRLGMGRQR